MASGVRLDSAPVNTSPLLESSLVPDASIGDVVMGPSVLAAATSGSNGDLPSVVCSGVPDGSVLASSENPSHALVPLSPGPGEDLCGDLLSPEWLLAPSLWVVF